MGKVHSVFEDELTVNFVAIEHDYYFGAVLGFISPRDADALQLT